MKFSATLLVIMTAAVALTACKRRKPDDAPAKVVVPISQAPRTSQTSLTAADADASAEMLNAYVKQWNTLKQRPLNDLNELVAAKIMPNLPPAPPGKLFRLDVAAQKVSLVEAGK